MNLTCELKPNWPRLAWLTQFSKNSSTIRLLHGGGIETGEDWFAEAVWDGPFEKAAFDQTDLVFGSGGRKRDDRWIFVSAGSTVDRLHWHQAGDQFTVSNSLACLTAAIGATVDAHDRGYFSFFESIILGLERYQETLATSAGDVHLIYYNNLVFDGQHLAKVEKPTIRRDFSTFAHYESFLTEAMTALGKNIADSSRNYQLKPIASISTGYDSPTGATVARHAGLKETISIIDARGGANDDGSEIARRLGLSPINIPRDGWRAAETALIDPSCFIASDAKGEDVYFAPAANVLAGRVFFSGYAGTRVWDKTEADYSAIRRGDQSGLSHTEARLHGGYLHVPVPFFAARQENDIRALGRAKEMSPWRLECDYDRPVCRRIVEEAGVPREMFGQEKKAASVLLFDRYSFLPPKTMESFQQWCEEKRVGKRTIGEHFATTARRFTRRYGGRLLSSSQSALQRIPAITKVPVLDRLAASGKLEEIANFEPEFEYLFPWALAETQRAYH